MTPRVKQTPSIAIIEALDVLAGQIRKAHEGVPDNIVFVLASGKSGRGNVHGHFAPSSWKDGHHEILISAESLARGPEATLGTLIHELAHAKANLADIRDTSNKGRYHNKKFKAIAEEMGIELELAPTIGWSVTTLPEETAAKYALGLARLEKSLVTYRVGFSEAAIIEPKPRNKTKAHMVCQCVDDEDQPDPVTVSIQWFERQGPSLLCVACDTFYTLLPAE